MIVWSRNVVCASRPKGPTTAGDSPTKGRCEGCVETSPSSSKSSTSRGRWSYSVIGRVANGRPCIRGSQPIVLEESTIAYMKSEVTYLSRITNPQNVEYLSSSSNQASLLLGRFEHVDLCNPAAMAILEQFPIDKYALSVIP